MARLDSTSQHTKVVLVIQEAQQAFSQILFAERAQRQAYAGLRFMLYCAVMRPHGVVFT